MKRSALIPLLTIPLLVLAGCSSDNVKQENNTDSFKAKEITMAPQWNLDNLVSGSWGEGNPTLAPVPTEAPENDNPEATSNEGVPLDPNYTQSTENNSGDPTSADTFLYNYVNFIDSSTKCTITGQISYTDSYRASRGDLFNSKDYLYNLVPPSQDAVADESVEKIDNYDFVVGKYTQPEEYGANPYHKTAVRVFSSTIPISDASGFADSELGNYNSDSSKGLAVVSIDYSCPSEADITDAQWKDGIKNFKLIFEKENPQEEANRLATTAPEDIENPTDTETDE